MKESVKSCFCAYRGVRGGGEGSVGGVTWETWWSRSDFSCCSCGSYKKKKSDRGRETNRIITTYNFKLCVTARTKLGYIIPAFLQSANPCMPQTCGGRGQMVELHNNGKVRKSRQEKTEKQQFKEHQKSILSTMDSFSKHWQRLRCQLNFFVFIGPALCLLE